MNDYSEKQIEELLELMPALMVFLRKRRLAHDPDAEFLFGRLDTHCWHRPSCLPGDICEGGAPRRAVAFCPRCGRHHERTGDAEDRCREGMRFADADHRRRGGTV